MVAVPAVTPFTLPDPSTVAMPVAVLLQAPPEAVSLKPVAEPAHTVAVPVTVPADGNGLTVTTSITAAVPQPLVTV